MTNLRGLMHEVRKPANVKRSLRVEGHGEELTYLHDRRNEGRKFVFFFSSRRRHTRLQGDWSSDVCSSDPSRRRHTNYKVTGVQTCALPICDVYRGNSRLSCTHMRWVGHDAK